MENYPELKKSSKDQQPLETSEKTVFPRASQRPNPRGGIRPEKPNLSYADLHHEITKNVKDVAPKSSGNHLKQRIDRKVIQEDELVKHMSNLPSYLERGENLQEKVLNVGVLDWGRLEKWQYSHKQIPHRSSTSSMFSSNTSSSLSTDESPEHSSRGRSCSPARQRMRRPSLQFHLMSSSAESHSQAVKSFGESVAKFQDLKAAKRNTFKEKGKFIRTDEPVYQSHSEIKLGQCEKKDSDLKIDPESETLPNGVNYEIALCTKLKIETQANVFMKGAEKLEERSPDDHDQDFHVKEKIVLLLPRDLPQNNLSGVSELSDSTTMIGQRAVETSRRSISERSKEVCHAEIHSDFLHRPFSREVDVSRHLQMKHTSSAGLERSNFSSEGSHSIPRFSKMGISPSKGSNLEHKRSTITPSANEPSTGSDLKLSKVESEKVRSTSPFRRFSFSRGKTSKSSSSKDGFALPQLSSMNVSAKSGTEKAVASSWHDSSSCDKPNAASRARTSPLRRLLESLMKPKAVNCRNFSEPLQKGSTSSDRTCRSLDGRPYSSTVTVQSGKVKLDMTSCRALNVNDSSKVKKNGSSALQALLRVAVKNGQPLFTFAVDNENSILAATLKKLSTSGKDDYSCIYTFFTIQEVKKEKGRWINQRGKGEGHDYIPNVVAQMRVSGSQSSNVIRSSCMDQFSIKEFVLFAVDLGQVDQQAYDFQENDELAAIVIKIPKRANKNLIRDGCHGGNYNDLPEVGLKEYITEERLNSKSGENVQNWPLVRGRDISATVILPSGVHGLPHKGGPSSLIQRWKSGGSCDCGGWDMGCKPRILSNRNQISKKSSSSRDSSIADQFELFFLGEEQENQPFFTFAPFKEGVYSVEFNSSLSLLQAFSICIATWDSRKLCELSESSNLFEDRTLGDRVRQPRLMEGEAPARYVSFPPLSPAGRV